MDQQRSPDNNNENAIVAVLEDIARECNVIGAQWALLGGQALIAYGVPHETDDIDVVVTGTNPEVLATRLCACAGWVPLAYRGWERDFVPALKPTRHRFDDLVLWHLPVERVMYSLRSAQGLLVQLLAAQHPVERQMIADATPLAHFGARVPVAPLGGVLAVKAIAARPKDIAHIEQAATHLPPAMLDEAVAWAEQRVPGAAQALAQIIEHAQSRRPG